MKIYPAYMFLARSLDLNRIFINLKESGYEVEFSQLLAFRIIKVVIHKTPYELNGYIFDNGVCILTSLVPSDEEYDRAQLIKLSQQFSSEILGEDIIKLTTELEFSPDKLEEFRDRGIDFLLNSENHPYLTINLSESPVYTTGEDEGGMLVHTEEFSEDVLKEVLLITTIRTIIQSVSFLLADWTEKISETVSQFREYLTHESPEMLDIVRERINEVKSNLESIFTLGYRSYNRYNLIRWEYIDEDEIEKKLKIREIFNSCEHSKNTLFNIIQQSLEGEITYSRLTILEDISRRFEYIILLLTIITEGIALMEIFMNETIGLFSKIAFGIILILAPILFIIFILLRKGNIRKRAMKLFTKHEKKRLRTILDSIREVTNTISNFEDREKYENLLQSLEKSEDIISRQISELE